MFNVKVLPLFVFAAALLTACDLFSSSEPAPATSASADVVTTAVPTAVPSAAPSASAGAGGHADVKK